MMVVPVSCGDDEYGAVIDSEVWPECLESARGPVTVHTGKALPPFHSMSVPSHTSGMASVWSFLPPSQSTTTRSAWSFLASAPSSPAPSNTSSTAPYPIRTRLLARVPPLLSPRVHPPSCRPLPPSRTASPVGDPHYIYFKTTHRQDGPYPVLLIRHHRHSQGDDP